ncbi:MAG: response regulator [Thermodesulfobacteriota bacterium]|nr:response regulator [Thermodesulfobacteriota bacterium]
MKILVAEDNAATRKMLETLLKKWEYEVSLAENGQEAWEIIHSSDPPRIILLDWMMPEMDGVELCKAIRASTSGLENSYVILLTARSEKEDIITGLKAGADDYISKPFNAEELRVRISSGRRIIELGEALDKRGKIQGVLEMAGAVCHELNQPLQAIMGHVQLAMLDVDADNPVFETMQTIKIQVDRMAEITNKLMRITRYETREYLNGTKIVDIDRSTSSGE